MSTLKKNGGLAGWIGTCFLAATFGSLFEPGAWYETLNKPVWTPPNRIFPIVWPILYLMMAIAAWMIWKDFGFHEGREALKWFGIQLGLNAAWSWIFFGEHLIGTALGEILLLWIAILFAIMLFWRKNKFAALMLVPYLLWISYASALNYSIFQMN